MVLLSIFFTRIRSTEGSSADCSLFILSLHALALHLAVKYYFKSFCEDLSTLLPYMSVVFPPECQQDLLAVTQPILLSENIPNIWHKSSTKHKEVRPDWNDKNDKCKLRALVSHGRFYQWLRLPFLKKYSIKCEKDLDCELFYSELKRHNVSLYLLSSHR